MQPEGRILLNLWIYPSKQPSRKGPSRVEHFKKKQVGCVERQLVMTKPPELGSTRYWRMPTLFLMATPLTGPPAPVSGL